MFKCFSISQKNEGSPSPVLDLRDSIFSNPLPPTTQPTVFWQTVPSNKYGEYLTDPRVPQVPENRMEVLLNPRLYRCPATCVIWNIRQCISLGKMKWSLSMTPTELTPMEPRMYNLLD